MGQSDWTRIGAVSDFYYDAEAKIPAFQIGRDLALSLLKGVRKRTKTIDNFFVTV